MFYFFCPWDDFNKLVSLRFEDIWVIMCLKMSRSSTLIFIVSAFHSTINTNNHGTVVFFFFLIPSWGNQCSSCLIISFLWKRRRNSDDTNSPPLLLDTWPAFFPTGQKETADFTFPMRRDMCLLASNCLRSYHVAQSDPIKEDRKAKWQFCLLKCKHQHRNMGANPRGPTARSQE